MYDTGKIVTGLVIFVAIVSFPFWGSIGGSSEKPKLVIPQTGRCIESAAYMRANHMQLLDEWRNSVVRDNNHVYVSKTYGTRHDISLSSTGSSLVSSGEKQSCMSCHSNKKEFCDACHNYASVKPYCWTCHIEPKENI
ncbi:MAG: sulfate reduction electron transfer complex DsrMKJOP subunit DsrJ [SAR324 cluster bacterium]|nr:sulfate reduction electron transfer complex DsrMKJOP subunit DsrJ [SAR324 cluster bacterium]